MNRETASNKVVEELTKRAELMIIFGERVKAAAKELTAPASTTCSRADRASFAVTDIENLIQNMNLAGLTRDISRLAVADAMNK